MNPELQPHDIDVPVVTQELLTALQVYSTWQQVSQTSQHFLTESTVLDADMVNPQTRQLLVALDKDARETIANLLGAHGQMLDVEMEPVEHVAVPDLQVETDIGSIGEMLRCLWVTHQSKDAIAQDVLVLDPKLAPDIVAKAKSMNTRTVFLDGDWATAVVQRYGDPIRFTQSQFLTPLVSISSKLVEVAKTFFTLSNALQPLEPIVSVNDQTPFDVIVPFSFNLIIMNVAGGTANGVPKLLQAFEANGFFEGGGVMLLLLGPGDGQWALQVEATKRRIESAVRRPCLFSWIVLNPGRHENHHLKSALFVNFVNGRIFEAVMSSNVNDAAMAMASVVNGPMFASTEDFSGTFSNWTTDRGITTLRLWVATIAALTTRAQVIPNTANGRAYVLRNNFAGASLEWTMLVNSLREMLYGQALKDLPSIALEDVAAKGPTESPPFLPPMQFATVTTTAFVKPDVLEGPHAATMAEHSEAERQFIAQIREQMRVFRENEMQTKDADAARMDAVRREVITNMIDGQSTRQVVALVLDDPANPVSSPGSIRRRDLAVQSSSWVFLGGAIAQLRPLGWEVLLCSKREYLECIQVQGTLWRRAERAIVEIANGREFVSLATPQVYALVSRVILEAARVGHLHARDILLAVPPVILEEFARCTRMGISLTHSFAAFVKAFLDKMFRVGAYQGRALRVQHADVYINVFQVSGGRVVASNNASRYANVPVTFETAAEDLRANLDLFGYSEKLVAWDVRQADDFQEPPVSAAQEAVDYLRKVLQGEDAEPLL